MKNNGKHVFEFRNNYAVVYANFVMLSVIIDKLFA